MVFVNGIAKITNNFRAKIVAKNHENLFFQKM